MWDRVARTKKEKTAWELIKTLRSKIPWVEFYVAMHQPDDGYEVVPVMALHPTDRKICEDLVTEFKKR